MCWSINGRWRTSWTALADKSRRITNRLNQLQLDLSPQKHHFRQPSEEPSKHLCWRHSIKRKGSLQTMCMQEVYLLLCFVPHNAGTSATFNDCFPEALVSATRSLADVVARLRRVAKPMLGRRHEIPITFPRNTANTRHRTETSRPEVSRSFNTRSLTSIP